MQAAQPFENGASTGFPTEYHPGWACGAMIGRSPVMQRLFSQIRHTARHLRIAAIEGEPGTGKMLAARTIHECGSQPESTFVPCAAARFFEAQPEPTANGAAATPEFASSAAMKQACGGTLALTRVDELSAAHQARLLDLLQWIDHQHILRALDSIPRQLLCLSSRPLRRLAAAGSLRVDLVSRLTAIRFVLPPLRERREDIPLLAQHFIEEFSTSHGKLQRGLGPQTLPRLVQHTWPGNVRELSNVVSAAVLSCPGQWIRPIDLPTFTAPLSIAASTATAPVQDDDPDLDRAILRHIQRVLARVDGNKLRAAKLLGISRSTLYRLLDTASHP